MKFDTYETHGFYDEMFEAGGRPRPRAEALARRLMDNDFRTILANNCYDSPYKVKQNQEYSSISHLLPNCAVLPDKG
jgi:phage replication-related protein YjqB (UPF0714/DUF867 family)